MTTRRPHAPCLRPHARGFTLIETALTTVIIGVGVIAIVEAQEAFMRSNNWSSHAATATFLGNEIREMTRAFPRHDSVTGLMSQSVNGQPQLVGWGREAGEVEVDDLDDVDDLDGLAFGLEGNMPGPIDAFGNVIPQTLPDGSVLMRNGDPVPLEGWSQAVFVEKVNPVNPTQVLANDFSGSAGEGVPSRAVNDFPLRVTVIVTYQGQFVREATEITRVVWIVP